MPNSSTNRECSLVLEKLKQVLKTKKITYAMLANQIGVAESTLKKSFIAKDVSFNRLNTICSALDISLGQILSELENEEVQEVSIDSDAEKYFLKKPLAFKVYWRLSFDRVPLEEIKKEIPLPKSTLTSILVKLDKLELIELRPDNTVKVPKLTPVRWKRTKTKIQEIIYLEWSKNIIQNAYDEKESDFDISLIYLQLREKNLKNFRRELHELEEKYAQITIRELKIHPEEIVGYRFVSSFAKGSFFK